MHHSSDCAEFQNIKKELLTAVKEEINEVYAKQVSELNLGATEKFPGGKLTSNDEGEIKIAVGTSDGKVVLNFGKECSWLGFSPKQARALAESLRQQSYKV